MHDLIIHLLVRSSVCLVLWHSASPHKRALSESTAAALAGARTGSRRPGTRAAGRGLQRSCCPWQAAAAESPRRPAAASLPSRAPARARQHPASAGPAGPGAQARKFEWESTAACPGQWPPSQFGRAPRGKRALAGITVELAGPRDQSPAGCPASGQRRTLGCTSSTGRVRLLSVKQEPGQ